MGNKKAKRWLNGRKNIFERLRSAIGQEQDAATRQESKIIWMHCSSLGEFEQGRPVLEQLKSQFPSSRILLTFFSPSGYEIRKNYEGADYVFYLPADSANNARRFFNIVKPSLVLFVKYDFWYYYIRESKERNIPLLLVSGIFRKEQPFFKWYGSIHRKMLRGFSHFFVQDDKSAKLLQSLRLTNSTIAGDTRFDRVMEVAGRAEPVAIMEKFCEGHKVLIAGSTWPPDEKIIKEAISGSPQLKLVIAPHEIDKSHLQELKNLFPGSIFFSQLPTSDSRLLTPDSLLPTPCLIIDNIGLLSKLYRYATITFVGGGFNRGIHNILEAAVYGKPVVFGPNYKKFREAVELIQTGGAVAVSNSAEMKAIIQRLLESDELQASMGRQAYDYVKNNSGATAKILGYIQEKRLLTNW